MKTKLLIISLLVSLCFCLPAAAQRSLRKATYKDETYYVYPYKYNSHFWYGNNDLPEDIMPVTDSLPDGQFIAFRTITNYKYPFLFRRKLKVEVDSTKPGVIFNVMNGKRNGPSYWYDEDELMMVSGNYLNGERDGMWHFYNSKGIIQKEIQMKNGLRDGLYYKFFDGIYTISGQFSEDKPTGTWYTYWYNGTVNNELNFCKDSAGCHAPVLYHRPRQLYSGCGVDNYDYSYSYYDNNYWDRSSYMDYTLGVEEFQTKYLHGPMSVYYANGQLYKKVNYKYGCAPYIDTVYYDNGKCMRLSKLINITEDTIVNYQTLWFDSLGRKRAEAVLRNKDIVSKKRFDSLGRLQSADEYLKNLFYSRKYYDTLGNLLSESYNSREFNPEKLHHDTLILDYRQFSKGKVICETKTIEPGDYDLVRQKQKFWDNEYYGHAKVYDSEICSDYTTGIDKTTGKRHIAQYYFDHDSTFVFALIRSKSNYKKYPCLDSVLLTYGGKPFTGKLTVNYYQRKPAVRKRKNKILLNSRYFENFEQFLSNDAANEDYYYYNNNHNSVSSFKNGRLEGVRKVYNRKHDVITVENRSNSLLDGARNTYDYCWKDTIHERRRRIYCLHSKTNYRKGIKEGERIENNEYGRIYSVSHYSNDMLNGAYTSYHKNGAVEDSAHYVNDSLDGKFYVYDDKGRLQKDLNFKNGLLDGVNYFHEYGKLLPMLAVHCSNGFLEDTSYEFFTDTKIVKKTFFCNLNDSLRAGFFCWRGHSYYDYLDLSSDIGPLDNKGITTYYYKTGTKSIEGRAWKYRSDTTGRKCKPEAVNDSNDDPHMTGDLWKFWDPSGNLIRQIDYGKLTLPNLLDSLGKDSIKTIGKFTEWYGSGKVKTEGYVMDEKSEYNCQLENYVYTQDIYYTNFWSYTGEQLVKDGNGYLLTYHNNGKVQAMTTIRKGLKDGIYKEWDPDGHLTKLGRYKNGLRTGRWLEGDLEGIAFVDGQCFSSPEEFENAVHASKVYISITETYYIRGEVVKTNTYSTNDNGAYGNGRSFY